MYQFEFKFLDNARQFTANLEAKFARINSITKQTQDKVADIGKPFNALNAGFARIGTMAAGAFAINEVVQFGRESVAVFNDLNKNAELLKMKLGAVETPKVLKELEQFADKMGASIPAVEDTFISLVNRGFKPTMDEMRQLSDFAVNSKKPIDQYMEAILDAEQNEYERLKEFGVKFSTNGNKIIATYNGVTKSISNNAKSIRQYLLGLGDMEGIKGASEKLASGLAGNMQRWENTMMSIKNNFGAALEPFLNVALPRFSNYTKEIADQLGAWKPKVEEFATAFDKVMEKTTAIDNFMTTKAGSLNNAIKEMFNPDNYNVMKGIWNFNENSYWAQASKTQEERFRGKQSDNSAIYNGFNLNELMYRSDGSSGQSVYDPVANIWKDIKENTQQLAKGNTGNLGLSDRLKQNTASVSGGQNIKHITININKLVETQQFNTMTVPQSKEDVKRLMTEILMSVVNDANYAT